MREVKGQKALHPEGHVRVRTAGHPKGHKAAELCVYKITLKFKIMSSVSQNKML